MNKITISEHSVITDNIKKDGWILDLGCVNFTFALGMKKYCDNIICVDPNTTISDIPEGLLYENKAVVNNDDKEITFYIYNDISGYSALNPSRDWCTLEKTIKVSACTIKDIMTKYGIEQFELIKFDIEGSEYSILENIDWTISKQYSIEFHDFRFMNPYYPHNDFYYFNLKDKLSKYCDIIQHEPTDHPGFPPGMGKNYWDSLFILKKRILEVMVIGNGLIANAFKEYVDVDHVLIFASGVSDSSENRKESFDREKNLLIKCSLEHKNKLIVYFSSANLFEDRAYFKHKQNMEISIKSLFDRYLIFRLPQVVGVGGNKNNLFNYFKNALINGDRIVINRNAYRSLLDIDDLVNLINLAVGKLFYKNETLTISYIEWVGAGVILDIISEELNITPNVEEVDGIEGYVVENSPVAQLLLKVYNKNQVGYIEKVIKKYL